MRATTAGLAAAAILATGCARVQDPLDLPALCEQERGGARGDPGAAAWVRLLLRGVDPETRRVTSPALDCTGGQVRWEGPALTCEDGVLARTALPERALTADDVIAAPAGRDLRLVWIVTGRFASGEALGPVALVEEGAVTLRVLAVGALRAFPKEVRLRLERLGPQTVLVAEGASCSGEEPTTCLRAARVLPLVGARFVATPVSREEGGCLSPGWFELARQEVRRVEGRWERVELGAQLVFGAAGLEIEELVTVGELASRQAPRPTRVLHRAQGTRVVRWQQGRLLSGGEPLWARLTSRP
jgi:hypothetical protein